jgi:hypothetical protein
MSDLLHVPSLRVETGGAMSDRRRQLELFISAPPPSPPKGIIGLAVHVDRHCCCGATIAVIIPGKGPHLTGLQCPECDQFRQWLPRAVFEFLTELVGTFGRPSEPIHIFEQVDRFPGDRVAHGAGIMDRAQRE